MPIDDGFLAILICPVTHQNLRRLDPARLAALNRRQPADGTHAAPPWEEALTTTDGRRIYPVRNGIPLLLAEEAVTDLDADMAAAPESNAR